MQHVQTKQENKKTSLATLMVLWSTMFMGLITYIITMYMILHYTDYKPTFSDGVLEQTLIGSLDIKGAIYLASFLVFWGTFVYFKNSLNNIKQDVYELHILDKDERFQAFAKRYTTLMFIALALFEIPMIAGIIIFLISLNFKSMLFLGAISAIGFFIVMPNRAKFEEYL